MTFTNHTAYLAELSEALTDERLSLIDFDRLRVWLQSIAPLLVRSESDHEELALFRQELEGRIAGMLKAIAVTDRKQHGLESALRSTEALPSMAAQQLIECYRHTSARFRDSFPSSFGMLRRPESNGHRASQYVDFK